MNEYFDLNYFLSILENKKTICMKDIKLNKNGIIVRHDVDYSVDFAFELSRYEKLKNINATYFVLLTSDFYNVFSKSSKEKIITMINDGFEIGLHFDPTVYDEQDDQNLLMYLEKEVNTFYEFFGYEIKSYSMHNPSITGTYIQHKNMNNAYDNLIFGQDIYISDSSYNYRGKNPKEFLEKSKDILLQYLTHPIHFFRDSNLTYNKQVELILENYYFKLDSALMNINTYRETKEKVALNEFIK